MEGNFVNVIVSIVTVVFVADSGDSGSGSSSKISDLEMKKRQDKYQKALADWEAISRADKEAMETHISGLVSQWESEFRREAQEYKRLISEIEMTEQKLRNEQTNVQDELNATRTLNFHKKHQLKKSYDEISARIDAAASQKQQAQSDLSKALSSISSKVNDRRAQEEKAWHDRHPIPEKPLDPITEILLKVMVPGEMHNISEWTDIIRREGLDVSIQKVSSLFRGLEEKGYARYISQGRERQYFRVDPAEEKERIDVVLKKMPGGVAHTVTDWMTLIPELQGLSNMEVSSFFNDLVNKGLLIKKLNAKSIVFAKAH